ncbi:MAG: DNA recombination protein RmuC [Parcubacteria group bacterium]
MLNVLIIILIVVSAALVWFVLDLKKKLESGKEGDKSMAILERLSFLSEQNRDMRRAMDDKLSETHRVTQDQINHTMRTMQGVTGQSAKQIADVVAGLTKLEETNKQVVNFSSQLQSLQNILKNPKQRGVLGEYFLEETLRNVLPPNGYQMQYKFKDGLIVDAVVFVKEKVVPIDSKFSLENYEKILSSKDNADKDKYEKLFKQDLKNRIDETAKYVKPAENTMDFAFMFIPSEAIYYDLLVSRGAAQVNAGDLIEYAFKQKHVIIVSPTNFLAYLQTVLQGLRALQIEESAKSIRANVEKLGKHMISYEDFMKKLGNSLSTSVNHFNAAHKEFVKIDKDVAKITDGEKTIEVMILEKPTED